ncbi:quinone oxidoreductase [Burkholderia pseudomallei]|nr:quinone oxidoreductase [Burkholderia pseudomallei]QBL78992.1 quinone oxidoreductase [Burkholderia pseudomallei]QBP56120.1 quinone oxidoreductase [Burkholderia pseudomallei]
MRNRCRDTSRQRGPRRRHRRPFARGRLAAPLRSLAHSLSATPCHAAPHRNGNGDGDGNDDRTPPPAGSARAARRADSRANRTRSRAHARRAGEIRRSRGPRRNGRRPRERRPNARSTHRPSAVDLGQSAPAGRSID